MIIFYFGRAVVKKEYDDIQPRHRNGVFPEYRVIAPVSPNDVPSWSPALRCRVGGCVRWFWISAERSLVYNFLLACASIFSLVMHISYAVTHFWRRIQSIETKPKEAAQIILSYESPSCNVTSGTIGRKENMRWNRKTMCRNSTSLFLFFLGTKGIM